MPPDIIGYLRWFKRFEQERGQLVRDTNQALREAREQVARDHRDASLGMPAPDTSSPRPWPNGDNWLHLTSHVATWNDTSNQFRQRRPPAACKKLAAAYTGALSQQAVYFARMQDVVSRTPLAGQTRQSPSIDNMRWLDEENRAHYMARDVEMAYMRATYALFQIRSGHVNVPADIDRGALEIIGQ